MRGEHERPAFALGLEEAPPSSACKLGIMIVDEVPVRVGALHRTVNEITAHHCGRALGGQADRHVTRRMPGSRLEPDLVVEGEVHVDQDALTRLHHRDDVLLEAVAPFFGGVVVLPPREHVASVGEGGHPSAIDEVCVPTRVVQVKVGAENVIDLFRVDSHGGEVFEPGRIAALVPGFVPVGRFVVADARVDQDGVVARPHQVGLDRQDQLAGLGTERLGLQPVTMGFEILGCRLGEHLGWSEKGLLQLENAMERDVSELPHRPLMVCRRGVPAAPLFRGASVRSAINEYAVAAGTLGRVAGTVGGSQYLVDGAAVGADWHDADGHRDVDGLVVVRKAERADGPLHGFGDALDLGQRAVLHEDRKGVAAHPRQRVAPADLAP